MEDEVAVLPAVDVEADVNPATVVDTYVEVRGLLVAAAGICDIVKSGFYCLHGITC